MFPNNTYDNMQVSVQGTLQIRGVQKDDDGYYICSALSVAGSTTSRAYLQVLTSQDSNPPPILQIVPANQTLPRGTVATLPCRASGNPTPMIRWMKNATDINLSGGNGRFSIIQGGTLRIDGKHKPLTFAPYLRPRSVPDPSCRANRLSTGTNRAVCAALKGALFLASPGIVG
uniref:Ig-like domain-containing protein n=1 Tax=Anopheles maculatus TaxID=74869 RepID=A0A182SY83_9DIPT